MTRRTNGVGAVREPPLPHPIALNIWAGVGAPPPPSGSTGLYHLAILYPGRSELARALRRLFESGYPLEGAADHWVSEDLYLRDPDGNGVELYVDRDPGDWPRDPDGSITMVTDPLDLEDLLRQPS